MATRSKPYEQLGRYILFRRLDAGHLVENWRGAAIDGDHLTPPRVIHRFVGGDLQTLRENVDESRLLVPSITGQTVVRDQQLDIVIGVPVITHEYTTGRTLRHIVDRTRSATTPAPIPVDQAVAIVERLALSIETLNTMKYESNRLVHGAILPSLVWVSDEGDVRLAGHLISRGILASLARPDVAGEISPWVAPEIRTSLQPTRQSDVYSLGAMLFLLLTGQEPPDPMDRAAHAAALTAATLAGSGAPVPRDLRPILERALALDPAQRFASAADLRQILGPLLHGGPYSATTFNLAFYLSSLLKKELEAEASERQREEKLNLAPYLETPDPAEIRMVAAPTFGMQQTPAKSRTPLIAAVVALVAIGAAGAWFAFGRKPAAQPAPVKAAAPAPAPKPAIEPIFESVKSVSPSTASGSADPEAQKKAFEDAVNKKLREEMLKLQAQFDASNKAQTAQTASTASVAAAPALTRPAAPQPDNAVSAEQLDQSRRELQPAAQSPQPAPAQVAAVGSPAASNPEPAPAAAAAPSVSEGDLVELAQLDQAPKVTRKMKANYPPMAARQKLEGYIFLSVLITETGRVGDVKVLRGDPRKIGFEEAAIQSVRNWLFSPGLKEGKRVRTWMPIAVDFKLQ